jgi:ubiquinone/menaquinone biosynthesis C-methylase UbiE
VEPGFNTSGWDSSYDLRPIPGDEMREWRDHTAERILATRPRRVLDVGCGTGLFLFRIAPHCEQYVGVDASAEALRAIERDATFASLRGVTLREARAHQLAERFAPASFDTVVFNSVVQYFPNVEYLVEALEQAARLVAPGGTLFVGDVRALPSLELLHESVAISQGPAERSLAEVRSHVRQRMAHETELVIDPAFFAAMRAHLPEARECRVLAKRGHVSNELTCYRYDVAIRLGGDPSPDAAAVPSLFVASLDEVRALLADRPSLLRLTDVLDARLARDLRAHALLRAAAGDITAADDEFPLPSAIPTTLGELRHTLDRRSTSRRDLGGSAPTPPDRHPRRLLRPRRTLAAGAAHPCPHHRAAGRAPPPACAVRRADDRAARGSTGRRRGRGARQGNGRARRH